VDFIRHDGINLKGFSVDTRVFSRPNPLEIQNTLVPSKPYERRYLRNLTNEGTFETYVRMHYTRYEIICSHVSFLDFFGRNGDLLSLLLFREVESWVKKFSSKVTF
jgi:hypothetical protein